jgi:hypothetical protein
MHSAITIDNWSFARFEFKEQQAGIFLGADPETLAQGEYLYYVTVMKNQTEEIFQKSFSSLLSALTFINETYRAWNFVELGAPSEGCGSCAAH